MIILMDTTHHYSMFNYTLLNTQVFHNFFHTLWKTQIINITIYQLYTIIFIIRITPPFTILIRQHSK